MKVILQPAKVRNREGNQPRCGYNLWSLGLKVQKSFKDKVIVLHLLKSCKFKKVYKSQKRDKHFGSSYRFNPGLFIQFI